jgi:UreE urease accessory protein, N-terminal domain
MAARYVSAGADEVLVRVDAVLGCATEGGWPGRLHLDQAEAQKSRLRKVTEGGTEVAISLDRGIQLAMAHRAHAHVTRVDAPHLSMISNPGTVTNVILQAVRATS